MTPQPFGSYELLQLIAQGGMSKLFLARLRRGRGATRDVLLKQVHPHVSEDPEHLALFHQEAKISAHLHHPNIAEFYEFGEVQGSHYIAREFVHGQPLDEVLRQALSTEFHLFALGLRIGASLCEGLHHAHTRVDHLDRPLKLVHGEVAARHILIGFDGGVKLIGFSGNMIALHQDSRHGGLMMGRHFHSMAPEQVRGDDWDPRTDIFSAALVIYELITGVPPLGRSSNLETLQALVECRFPPPSEVAPLPSVLDSVLMKALAREKQDRYRDAREFQLALEEALVTCRWVVRPAGLAAMMKTLFPQGAGAT